MATVVETESAAPVDAAVEDAVVATTDKEPTDSTVATDSASVDNDPAQELAPVCRCGMPLFVRSEETAEPLRAALSDPPVLTRAKLGRRMAADVKHDLRRAVADLRARRPELAASSSTSEAPWQWARHQLRSQRQDDLTSDELVCLRLCAAGNQPDFLASMNRYLFDFQPGTDILGLGCPWETFIDILCAALAKLRCNGQEFDRLVRLAWVPRDTWAKHFDGKEGSNVCFCGAQPCSTREAWDVLEQPVKRAVSLFEGSVPCVFEFDSVASAGAADIGAFAVADGVGEDVLLPPYTRGVIRSVEKRGLPSAPHIEAFHVVIQGHPAAPEPLQAVLDAPAETVLAGSLLVGLHTSSEGAHSPLLSCLSRCFQSLTIAAQCRRPGEVKTAWKSYWECIREGCHSWREIKESAHSGVIPVAGVAVQDALRASRGVAGRLLGLQSSVDQSAMDKAEEEMVQEMERRKHEAVGAVRSQILAFGLETLNDPEAFLRFLEFDPMKMFEAGPCAFRAFLAEDIGPEQRVLMIPKLVGLAAVAGRLMEGEDSVRAAFESPFPFAEHAWDTFFSCGPSVLEDELPTGAIPAAKRAVALTQAQRMQLSRTRILIVGGSVDVGKTTILREVFGLNHLAAGLSRESRTDQLVFELHPNADQQFCPVYVVDTPGFGDGEQLYRNDMGRVLVGTPTWIPGGVTLLWVVKAGRQVKQRADDLLQKLSAAGASVLVVVTHMDRMFEERYREAGPQWRDTCLKGVPPKDARWRERRRELYLELREEVEAGVRSVTGNTSQELIYACLAGWMIGDAEDEFEQPPPWPWARSELTDFFGMYDRDSLRKELDARLGL